MGGVQLHTNDANAQLYQFECHIQDKYLNGNMTINKLKKKDMTQILNVYTAQYKNNKINISHIIITLKLTFSNK